MGEKKPAICVETGEVRSSKTKSFQNAPPRKLCPENTTARMSDNEPEDEQPDEPEEKQAEEKKVPDPAVEEVIEGVVA
eukprot:g33610.t1